MNQRREVAWEVKRPKNNWFQQKAREVERGMNRGKGTWKGLREIQKGRAGLQSVKPSAVKHLNGTKCVGQDDTLQWWHKYFELVLNVNSSFDKNVFQSECLEKLGLVSQPWLHGWSAVMGPNPVCTSSLISSVVAAEFSSETHLVPWVSLLPSILLSRGLSERCLVSLSMHDIWTMEFFVVLLVT